LVGAKAEELEEGKWQRVRTAVEVKSQKEIEPPTQPNRSEYQFLNPAPVPGIESGSYPLPGQIESTPFLRLPDEE
jgi:hypothetical protein